MTPSTYTGRVIRSQAGFYTVQLENPSARPREWITCRLRGRFKQGSKSEDLVVIGDRVEIVLQSDGTGVIEKIEPRGKVLERSAPAARGEYRQILLANADQVLLVFACAHPNPSLRMLDRFLVIAEKQQIEPLVIANKVDLVGLEKAKEIFRMYPALGYRVIYTSAVNGLGIEELRLALHGKISALAGPSGVGKSSLLGAVQPGLELAVRRVSGATSKGRHTTTVRELFPLEGGGYVADMPGLRSLALWDTEPEELDGYFPELRPLVKDCQFSDCTHTTEPGCAVISAVNRGDIFPERYISYLKLRFGDDVEPANLRYDNIGDHL